MLHVKPIRFSIILLFLISSCNISSSLVEVKHHSVDSSRFNVLPISFSSNSQEKEIQVSFAYDRPPAGRTTITCEVSIVSEEERLSLSGLGLEGNDLKYFASTFDYLAPEKKGKDQYIHTITFFVPERDFQKMTENNSIALLISEQRFEVDVVKWKKVREEISNQKLLTKEGNS